MLCGDWDASGHWDVYLITSIKLCYNFRRLNTMKNYSIPGSDFRFIFQTSNVVIMPPTDWIWCTILSLSSGLSRSVQKRIRNTQVECRLPEGDNGLPARVRLTSCLLPIIPTVPFYLYPTAFYRYNHLIHCSTYECVVVALLPSDPCLVALML